MRDLSVKPYSEDELRVCEYLQSIAPQIGCGDDPIGFILASHAALSQANAALTSGMKAALESIEKSKKILDDYKKVRDQMRSTTATTAMDS